MSRHGKFLILSRVGTIAQLIEGGVTYGAGIYHWNSDRDIERINKIMRGKRGFSLNLRDFVTKYEKEFSKYKVSISSDQVYVCLNGIPIRRTGYPYEIQKTAIRNLLRGDSRIADTIYSDSKQEVEIRFHPEVSLDKSHWQHPVVRLPAIEKKVKVYLKRLGYCECSDCRKRVVQVILDGALDKDSSQGKHYQEYQTFLLKKRRKI